MIGEFRRFISASKAFPVHNRTAQPARRSRCGSSQSCIAAPVNLVLAALVTTRAARISRSGGDISDGEFAGGVVALGIGRGAGLWRSITVTIAIFTARGAERSSVSGCKSQQRVRAVDFHSNCRVDPRGDVLVLVIPEVRPRLHEGLHLLTRSLVHIETLVEVVECRRHVLAEGRLACNSAHLLAVVSRARPTHQVDCLPRRQQLGAPGPDGVALAVVEEAVQVCVINKHANAHRLRREARASSSKWFVTIVLIALVADVALMSALLRKRR